MSEISKEKIEKIVLKAQKGDIDAFAKLYDHYVQRIYRYVFFKVENEAAQDITETVFLKSWEHLRKYRRKPGSSFSAWIYRIAHNLIADHHRMKKETAMIDPRIADTKKESNPELVAEQSISQRAVRSALKRMKQSHRDVLTLYYLNDLDHSEISKVLKKSEGSLRVLKYRALSEMKNILAEMGIDY